MTKLHFIASSLHHNIPNQYSLIEVVWISIACVLSMLVLSETLGLSERYEPVTAFAFEQFLFMISTVWIFLYRLVIVKRQRAIIVSLYFVYIISFFLFYWTSEQLAFLPIYIGGDLEDKTILYGCIKLFFILHTLFAFSFINKALNNEKLHQPSH